MENSNQVAADLPEWMPWEDVRLLMAVLGVCGPSEDPALVGEWAEQGELLTRACLYFVNGKLKKLEIIPIDDWRAARQQGTLDLLQGHLECENEGVFEGKRKVRARDIQVNTECLRELLQLDESDAAAAHARLAASATGLDTGSGPPQLEIYAPKPKATLADLTAWIVERVQAGDTQTEVERNFRSAFLPDKVVRQNRDQVRDIYETAFHDLRKEPLRPGKRARG